MKLSIRTKIAAMAAMMIYSIAPATAAGNGTVHLKGQLVDMGTNNVTMRYDGAASMVGNSRDVMIKTDSKGFFDVVVNLKEPAYYNISRNTLYLTPGDDMTVKITQNNSEATFSGRGATANNYMKGRLFPHGGSFLEAGSNVRAGFDATRTLIDSLAQVRRAQLEALKGVSQSFKDLENARIEADVLNSYLMYPSYSNMASGVKDKEQRMTVFKAFYTKITPLMNAGLKKLSDDRFLDVNVVRSVLEQIDADYASDMKEWVDGFSFSPRAKALFQSAEYVEKLRQGVTPEVLKEVKDYAANLTYKDLAAEIDVMTAKAGKMVKGQPAADFEFTDLNGGVHHLSDFKGKAIYLDFWATWCGPCIQESPHFEELAKEFKGRDIVFIPVSIDTGKAAWKRYLASHKKQLTQYNSTDKDMSSGWLIHYIPRFILIDKNFNIVSAYAPLPSTPEARTLVKSVLGE